jgi:hypothetical protein
MTEPLPFCPNRFRYETKVHNRSSQRLRAHTSVPILRPTLLACPTTIPSGAPPTIPVQQYHRRDCLRFRLFRYASFSTNLRLKLLKRGIRDGCPVGECTPSRAWRSLVAQLPWAHLDRFQRPHPFRPAFNVSNNLGNLLFARRYPQCQQFEVFWYSFGTVDQPSR